MRKVILASLTAGLLLLAGMCRPLLAAEAKIDEVLAGKIFSLTVRLKDMKEGWRRFTPGSQSDAGSRLLDMVMRQQMNQPTRANIYYTKGEVVTLAGETFLVAYSRPQEPLDPQAMQGQAPRENRGPLTALPLSQNTELSLCLLNLRTIGNLVDIHPFSLLAEIADSLNGGKVVGGPAEQQSVANMRQLATAVIMYLQDHKMLLPALDDPDKLKANLFPYVGNAKIFLQPTGGEPYQGNPMLAGKNAGEYKNPAEVIILFEVTPNADGKRVVAFLDGHVDVVDELGWNALKAKMNTK